MAFPINARFAHPGAGWKADQEQCARLLTPGQTYTVSHLKVGPFSSALGLARFPGEQFNTVNFDAAGSEDQDDEITAEDTEAHAREAVLIRSDRHKILAIRAWGDAHLPPPLLTELLTILEAGER